MNISAYPRTPMLSEDNVFITDSQENGTKGIKAKMLASQLLGFLDQDSLYAWYDAIKIPVWDRRRVYRGKNLGNSVTPLQQARIRNGTFEDLFIGDYWVINGHEYVILDFDYYMGAIEDRTTNPSTLIYTHHVTLYVKNLDIVSKYSETNVSGIPTDGYYGSDINTSTIPNVYIPIIEADLGDHFQEIYLVVPNSIDTSGNIISYSWLNGKAFLPTARMILGDTEGIWQTRWNLQETKPIAYFQFIKPDGNFGFLRDVTRNGMPMCISNENIQNAASNAEHSITPIFNIQYGLQGG